MPFSANTAVPALRFDAHGEDRVTHGDALDTQADALDDASGVGPQDEREAGRAVSAHVAVPNLPVDRLDPDGSDADEDRAVADSAHGILLLISVRAVPYGHVASAVSSAHPAARR